MNQNSSYGICLLNAAAGNTIGGTAVGAGNVISGNGNSGIYLLGNTTSGNQVQGNLIGTNKLGTAAIANAYGVFLNSVSGNVIGGTASGAGNVISGNGSSGIYVLGGGGNSIQGNLIGTDKLGSGDLGNAFYGVYLNQSANNTVGGTTPEARNVISGNDSIGVCLSGAGATGNVIAGNYLGTDATGMIALRNSSYGIYLLNAAAGNTIGGTAAGAGNVISGNGNSGIYVLGGTSGNTVQGNLIGTNRLGTLAIGNTYGVYLNGVANHVIGGTAAGAGNVISGNGSCGIYVLGGTSGNTVQGNLIGTNKLGSGDLGNVSYGVYLNGAANNTIGGTTPEARNVISGNDSIGVCLSGAGAMGNVIAGNYLGTDTTGMSALRNSSCGIYLLNAAAGNTIGGTAAGSGNVISGNGYSGIYVVGGTSGNTIQGNLIGTNKDGTAAIGNTYGVYLNGAANNVIGGTMAGSGNVISGNSHSGIYVVGGTVGNTIQGNLIGTNKLGTAAIANVHGVFLNGAANNTIGGTTAGAGNVISGNGSCGVYVTGSTATGNAVLGNSIYGNGSLGIDLAPYGATANDAGDADSGPNNLQNYPVIDTAKLSGSTTTVSGTLGSQPNKNYRLEFFANTVVEPSGYGEGQTYLGAVTVTTDANGIANFNFSVSATLAPAGQSITATATELIGPNFTPASTSEFSAAVAVQNALMGLPQSAPAASGADSLSAAGAVLATDAASPTTPATAPLSTTARYQPSWPAPRSRLAGNSRNSQTADLVLSDFSSLGLDDGLLNAIAAGQSR